MQEYHIVRVRVSKTEYYSMQANQYLGLAVYSDTKNETKNETEAMLRFSASSFPTALQFNVGQEYKISGKKVGEEAKVVATNFTAICEKDGSGADKALEFKVTEVGVKEKDVTMK